jgi:zinc transport system ATP-binding protein
MNAIEVKNLTYAYDGSPAVLEHISFNIKQGAFTAVLGANGSGKTTLAKLLLGLLPKQSGTIKFWGRESSNGYKSVGYLEQKNNHPSLMPITAFDVVKMGLLGAQNRNKRNDAQATLEVMQTARCDDFKDMLFNRLSGGQQQRVLLARTIINDPKLLILDEPSTALDSNSRGNIFEFVSRMNKERGTTVLLITHDNGEIGKFASGFLILDKKIIFHGDKQAFCSSQEVSDYLGQYNQHIIDHLHTHESVCPFRHNEGER